MFTIKFDDFEAGEELLETTPSKPSKPAPALGKKDDSPAVSSTPAPTVPASDSQSSSTSSSWNKAEAEEEPWVEVDYDKDIAPAAAAAAAPVTAAAPVLKQSPEKKAAAAPLQIETPKKAKQENKENLGGHNSNPSTPQKDTFLTPSIIRNRDFPSTRHLLFSLLFYWVAQEWSSSSF